MKALARFFIGSVLSLSSFVVLAAPMTIEQDKLTNERWTTTEQQNVKLIADFVQNVMNNHDFEYVLSTFNHSGYVQHNRNLPDGLTGLVGFLEEFVSDYPEYGYDVKHIYADGEFVIFHSHVTLNEDDRGNDEKGMNIIDKWRIEDGKIVEHWDAIQALDGFMRFYALVSGGRIRNENGVF
jgi:predicted SnoaL-like aldol condensation-catalyzing enzyme